MVVLLPCLLGAAPPKSPEADGAAFAKFIAGVKRDGKARGLKAETLAVLDAVEPLPRVIELDRKQPESTMTFARFQALILTEERISLGRQRLEEDRALLDKASQTYGIPAEVIVALWGLETKYGAIMGDYSVPAALATLAFEGRRRKFFRGELLHALTILDRGHITASAMKGSWAGAMGQPQFMPSTFLRNAADGDGDGRADIWTSKADVFASAANYLARIGWKKEERWGREVKLPADLDPKLLGLGAGKTLAQWRKLGVTTATGEPLPDEAKRAWLIQPDGPGGTAVLAYANFKVILEWNRSKYFASAVGMLSDRIAASPKTEQAGETAPSRP